MQYNRPLTMTTIVVSSTNPVKIQSARSGFEKMFPGQAVTVRSVAVPSGVSDQPVGDAETFQGAYGRACGARDLIPQSDADYWLGIEGGVEDLDGEMCAFAWVVVLDGSRCGKARSGAFYLPHPIAELVRAGRELGEADDIVFERSNSKQANGAVGILTGDALDRAGLYEQAVLLALIPFKNPELYSSQPAC